MFRWISLFNRKKKQDLKIDPLMKYLIVGLGNMGPDYEDTRHNVGFDVVDQLAASKDCVFKPEQLGDLTSFKYKGRIVYLLKPSTFMNLSGKAVRYWVNKLKIPDQNWLIVVDEFQFDLGEYKLQKKGSPGGHNGLKSIEDYMQTSTYPRLRIGIGHDFPKGGQVDYVLGRCTPSEHSLLQPVLKQANEVILSFVGIGLERSMSLHNRKKSAD